MCYELYIIIYDYWVLTYIRSFYIKSSGILKSFYSSLNPPIIDRTKGGLIFTYNSKPSSNEFDKVMIKLTKKVKI